MRQPAIPGAIGVLGGLGVPLNKKRKPNDHYYYYWGDEIDVVFELFS